MADARRKAIIIGRVGDGSLHRSWIAGPGADTRVFDLHLSYFGDNPDPFPGTPADVTISFEKGLKFPGLDECITKLGARLSAYEWICFVDDDIWAPCDTWNRFFAMMDRLRPALAQPALKRGSFYGHIMTLERPSFIARWTNFVEIMNFCFRRDFFEKVRPTFTQSVSGWGLDHLWAAQADPPTRALAIIDATPVLHTRAVTQGGLYEVLPGGVAAAQAELHRLLDGRPQTFIAYAGVRADGALYEGRWLNRRIWWPRRVRHWRKWRKITRIAPPSDHALLLSREGKLSA